MLMERPQQQRYQAGALSGFAVKAATSSTGRRITSFVTTSTATLHILS
jgi:hypothetical protein